MSGEPESFNESIKQTVLATLRNLELKQHRGRKYKAR
jgi:hypothetical protein